MDCKYNNKYLLKRLILFNCFGKIERNKNGQKRYVKEDEIASKYLEIHYIELPKFVKRNPEKYTKLDQWM